MSFAFLIEMAWKSALIAGAALMMVTILRSRAAADRAAVLRVAVALLLLLPVLSLGLPKLEIEAWSAEAMPLLMPDAPAAMSAADASTLAALAATPAAEPTIWDDPSLLFLLLYLGGVAMAASRLGAGLWTLARWTRTGREVTCPEWIEAFERARWATGAPRRLRLMVCDEAPSPLSWGLIDPVILIDRDTLDQPEDADAILAHEIAHVVRRDWAVLMATRIAAALFWFNPLVWVLEREVVQQAEEAADIEAALWVEPARYAQTLVHWAQFSADAAIPANSIAPSTTALARRVRAILDARLRTTPSGSLWTLAAIAGCATFALALAVLQLIPAVAEAREAPAPVEAPAAVAAPEAPAAPVAVAAPVPVPEAAALVVTGARPALPEDVPAPPATSKSPIPPTPPTPPLRIAVRTAQLPAAIALAQAQAARARVDVDTLVQLRIHDVDPAYIRALVAANPRLRRIAPAQLVALRIHDVEPAFVRAMAAAGYGDLTPEQLVAMTIHGVSASDARRAARDGRRASAEELVARAIRGED